MAVICEIIGSIGGCCEAPPSSDSHLFGQSDHGGTIGDGRYFPDDA